MSAAVRQQLLIVLVAGFVFFTNLGTPRLWDRDEPRNAGCAREMWQRGDWIVPTFNAELRAHKPALLYWLMISAYQVFGPTEFAARFWSAILGVGTCLLTYHAGRILFSPRAGLWAGLAIASCLNFAVVARAATPDSVYIFFSTAVLVTFVAGALRSWKASAASELPSAHPSAWCYAACYSLMGLAVLAKGPIGVLLPGLAMFLFLLYLPEQRSTLPAGAGWKTRLWVAMGRAAAPWSPRNVVMLLWSMRPLMAMAIVGAIALPWYIAVGVRTGGDFLAVFIGTHNVGRFMQPMEGHGGPIFYYLIAILIGFFPWSIFMGPMIAGWWNRMQAGEQERLGAVFLGSWALAYVGFFSLAGTKLPSYVLPAYPALALVAGCYLDGLLAGRFDIRRYLVPVSFWCFIVVGLGLMIGLPLALHFFLPGEYWLGLVGLAPLAGGAACLWLVHQQRLSRALAGFAASAAVFTVSVVGIGATRVDRYQTSEWLMARIRANSPAEHQIATFGILEPTWVYYAGRPIRECASLDEMRTFLSDGPYRYVITTERELPRIQSALPQDVGVLLRQPRLLRKGEIVVLGRSSGLADWSPYDPRRAANEGPLVQAAAEGGLLQR